MLHDTSAAHRSRLQYSPTVVCTVLCTYRTSKSTLIHVQSFILLCILCTSYCTPSARLQRVVVVALPSTELVFPWHRCETPTKRIVGLCARTCTIRRISSSAITIRSALLEEVTSLSLSLSAQISLHLGPSCLRRQLDREQGCSMRCASQLPHHLLIPSASLNPPGRVSPRNAQHFSHEKKRLLLLRPSVSQSRITPLGAPALWTIRCGSLT